MRPNRVPFPFALGLASLCAGALSACSLTGPLDGYATGDPPAVDAAVPDASSEETGTSGCKPGFTDCDGDPSNGCEADLLNDTDHCGSCSTTCNDDFAVPACVEGLCTITSCEANHEDCDQKASTGCEVDVTSSPSHCGECGQACQLSHGTPVCQDSSCAVGTCDQGWGDCDDAATTGCETNTLTTLEHCGECDNPCPTVTNGDRVCQAGSCGFVCKPRYGDCDTLPANGCEVDLWVQLANCGSCGNACSSVNGTPTCANGHCGILCTSGFGDCNADVEDGCEANTSTDPAHCGTCAIGCPAPDGATANCVASACGFKCITGRGDCNIDGADGCESDLLSDPNNCGACGHACVVGGCVDGYCEPESIAKNLSSPQAIGVDATHVYWTDPIDGVLYRQVKDGSLPHEAMSSPGSAGFAIALDNSRVYFSTSDSIRARNKVNANDVQLASGQVNVRAIAVDASGVYWVTGGTTGTDGTVMRVDLSGANLSALATAQAAPGGLTLFGTSVYWTSQGTWSGATYNDDGALWRTTTASGSSPVLVAGTLPRPCGIGIDGSFVVWANRQNGSLYKKDTSGGSPVFLLAGQTFYEDLVTKDGAAYWTFPGAGPSSGSIMRFPLAAGTVRAVAVSQNYPRRVAVDSTHVYWTAGGAADGDGAVYRVVR